MATNKVKSIKKKDWQKLAKLFNVKFENKNTVRYLCEKVAEKVGVDDKIVNLDDLKQALYDNLTAKGYDLVKMTAPKSEKTSEQKEEIAQKPEPSKEEKDEKVAETENEVEADDSESDEVNIEFDEEEIAKLRTEHYRKEASRLGVNFGMEQTADDIKQILEYHVKNNPHVTINHFSLDEVPATVEEESGDSELEQLRAECTQLGLGYGEKHTVEDLKQLIQAVKGASVAPVAPSHNVAPQANHNPIAPQTHPTHTPMNTKLKTNDVTEVSKSQLSVYRNVFNQAIRGHWRTMSVNEINDLFKQAEYPFTHVVKRHPEQNNKAEIILTSGDNTLRLPSDDENDWFDING